MKRDKSFDSCEIQSSNSSSDRRKVMTGDNVFCGIHQKASVAPKVDYVKVKQIETISNVFDFKKRSASARGISSKPLQSPVRKRNHPTN
jgi:hypothetical protein